MKEIRFDDIDALNAMASDEFGDFGEQIEVSQDMINKFAELTGDHQWIHVDPERARRYDRMFEAYTKAIEALKPIGIIDTGDPLR